jgi:hypothetical protein
MDALYFRSGVSPQLMPGSIIHGNGGAMKAAKPNHRTAVSQGTDAVTRPHLRDKATEPNPVFHPKTLSC